MKQSMLDLPKKKKKEREKIRGAVNGDIDERSEW